MNELFAILRMVWDSEKWLVKQFSVTDFACLGFGDYLEFLEKQLSRLPERIMRILTVHKYRNSPVAAYIAEHQMLLFLSQAAWELNDDTTMTIEEIAVLLHKQFPLISFELSDSLSVQEIVDFIRKYKGFCPQRNTMYSAALLSRSNSSDSSMLTPNILGSPQKWMFECRQNAGSFGHMTSVDAVRCLLKAPMLSDLDEWSHWDRVFAPSLGPLLNFLEKEQNTSDLLCLVTRSGKVIRIDSLASMDAFLAAAVKGSGKETAVQLVSIVSLYGGTHHAPVALMKSHACRAIEVLVKNSMDCYQLTEFTLSDNCPKARLGERKFCIESDHTAVPWKSVHFEDIVHKENTESFQNVKRTTWAIRVAARFILDCLFCLPSEFRTFAADILLSGLSLLSEGASQIILCECVTNDQRLMLHEIGLCIGIVDWINDYRSFYLDASHVHPSTESHEGKSNAENNVQSCIEGKSRINRLEGIHSPDKKMFEKKEAPLVVSNQKMQFEDLSDQKRLQTNHKECDKYMPSCEGFDGDTNNNEEEDAKSVIEAIRREEFGLDSKLHNKESDLLKKQHARLGRALHCLSQELYSQDSHFLLELVQNADDNLYPQGVEPALAFILQSTGVVVLNNELGFTSQNIRALCDVGNSTKKGSSAGYIGQKGIGFKSVFRVTDVPEIHSKGFHIKFDISEGKLGFILPTLVPPRYDIDSFHKELATENDKGENSVWNTCIVLPFKSSVVEGTGMRSWASKFADLHPSLLLFLHRLRCIKVRNSLTNSLKIMRREDIGNGLVKVSHGIESTTWLVTSQKLNAGITRLGVQTTEIALAFTLSEDPSGEYGPYLEQQPVFAFLPLRAYGLKFILQGDFILPSSREEVDGDSAWNQWLLSEFPELFVSAAESFKALPCFCSNPGKAVTLYMSFVPLVGEVLGFFSPLPRMIISRLRASQCLPLDGKDKQWVLPCMALRGWSDQIRMLLPDDLRNNHLGLGYLHRDVALSDPLATVLGVHTFGAGTLIEIMKSICKRRDALKNLGLEWIGSWLVALYDCLNVRPTATQSSVHVKTEPDSLSALGQIPFIPLSDGSYTSLVEGSIWIPCEATEAGNEGAHILKNFPNLYCELRTVDPSLFFSGAVASDAMIRGDSDIIMRMLRHVGVGQLSAHEVVMTHILPALSDVECMTKNKLLVTEYLAFIMQHLQSNCSACIVDRPKLILQLQKKAVIMTNNGYKRAGSEPLHFSKEFGNPTDMSKLLAGTNVTWNEIDSVYLKFSCNDVQLLNLSQWRNFFGELGVTDFVQVLNVEKKVNDQSCSIWKDVPWDSNPNSVGWIVKDWESPELVEILTALSSSRESVKQCSYLLEILDTLWDDLYGTKECVYWCGNPDGKVGKHTQTSCVLKMHAFQWVKSTLDGRLHLPTDLFFDCDDVKCILGPHAPYATPQVHSKKFVADIGFRTHVLAKDALDLLHVWSKTENVFKASTAQMGRLYSFLWTRMATCREEIVSHFRKESCIFVPFVDESNQEELVPGMFVSLEQVYWRDPTGCLDLLKKTAESSIKLTVTEHSYCRALYQIYPNLYSFFVNECHVLESPNFDGYVNILQHLSRIARPSQVSSEVMQVLIKWAEDVESERVDCKEISRWKECLCELENAVLPTMQDKWVSLHPNFGLVCWCDDLELEKQFKHSNGVCFLLLNLDGNTKRVKKVPSKLITFLHAMGIPPLSEVVMREAIFYGVQDSRQTTSLINWILPYAQRYVYKMHPEVYSVLKDTSFNNLLNQLRLLVVEKLFYRHTLKGCHSVSNERNECSCLLQGSNLYVSRMADFSAIYLEFSRVFFNGCVNLQLANFLHLITIMAETGAAEEQTESFILNTQNIPRLPLEEENWFLEYREEQIDSCPVPSNPSPSENNLMTKKPPKLRADACWPPTTWISAPKSRDDFKHVAKEVGWAANSSINQYLARNDYNSDKEKIHVSSSSGNSACESDWIIGDFSASVLAAVPHDAKAEHDKHTGEIEFNGESAINGKSNAFLEASLTGVGNNNIISQSQELSDTNIGASLFNMRDQLFVGVPDDEQRQLTGRLGELIVYKYLIEKYGPASVNWVNEKEETGLAFDIIVSKEDGKEEYIEVKATRSQNKDWFEITNREWDFASKNSDCFTIIRVFLASPQYAKFVLLANPIKLCQQKLIKLAILMPAHPYSALPEVSIIPQAVGIDGGF